MSKYILTTLRYVTLALLLASPGLMASTVYKWVDEEGVVHYGTRAPTGKEASSFTPKTGHSEPVKYDTQNPETEGQNTEEQTQKRVAQPDPERCEAARNNLKALNNFGRIRVRTEDGGTAYLTEEEQQKRIAEAEKVIEEAC